MLILRFKVNIVAEKKNINLGVSKFSQSVARGSGISTPTRPDLGGCVTNFRHEFPSHISVTNFRHVNDMWDGNS